MDGFELNKIFGALVGALGVFLALTIVIGAVFGKGGHHGDHHDELAFRMETTDGDVAEVEEEDTGPEPITPLLATASLDDGAKVFRQCGACHSAEAGGANKVGPALYGVMGRDIAGIDFGYSSALSGIDGVWDFEKMNAFLAAPKDWAPGTSMGFRGIRKPEDRAAVIAWLNQQSDTPLPLPTAE